MVRQMTPGEAAAILESDPTAIYLDVRSEPEFQAGHPSGAYNVPLLHLDEASGRPEANADFQGVVVSAFEKTRRIVVGCQSGGRSQRAAEILLSLGFRDVSNMQGGFGGARDRTGQVSMAGWQESGFPVDTTPTLGRTYPELSGNVF